MALALHQNEKTLRRGRVPRQRKEYYYAWSKPILLHCSSFKVWLMQYGTTIAQMTRFFKGYSQERKRFPQVNPQKPFKEIEYWRANRLRKDALYSSSAAAISSVISIV